MIIEKRALQIRKGYLCSVITLISEIWTSTRILNNRYFKESIIKMVFTNTDIKALIKSNCNALYMSNEFIIKPYFLV